MLVYDGPPYRYTTLIPSGTRALRQAVAERWSLARTEVVRDRARCDAAPSEHCECRAVDAFSAERAIRRAIFDAMVARADDLGVQSVIADRRVWGFGTWRERAYTGPNPHTDHCHVGLTRHAAQTLTLEHCRRVLRAAGPNPEEPMYSLEQIAAAVWDHALRNLMHATETKPAGDLLSFAHVDANTAQHYGAANAVNLADIVARLERIEARLSS